MTEILNELYYMVDTWAGQQYENDEETKGLEAQKFALEEEIVRRIGEDGQELVEELSSLSLKLEDIHDEALFRASVCLAVEMTGKVPQARPSPARSRTARHGGASGGPLDETVPDDGRQHQ